ncbi:MAG: hypothetical protein R2771_04965 [Saprospiraceae bacterium]
MTSEFNGHICRGGVYDFNGIQYNSPGVYIDTLFSLGGCDSIYFKLDLEYPPDFEAQITMEKDTLCLGELAEIYSTFNNVDSLQYLWYLGIL